MRVRVLKHLASKKSLAVSVAVKTVEYRWHKNACLRVSVLCSSKYSRSKRKLQQLSLQRYSLSLPRVTINIYQSSIPSSLAEVHYPCAPDSLSTALKGCLFDGATKVLQSVFIFRSDFRPLLLILVSRTPIGLGRKL